MLRRGRPVVKVLELWLKRLEEKTPEEIVNMAKEIKQIRSWNGSGWNIEAYELLLEDNGHTTVAIDTTGNIEVVYQGDFISLNVNAKSPWVRRFTKAFENIKAVRAVLDRRFAG